MLIEDLGNKPVSLYPMELAVRCNRHNAAALLTSVLKRMQAIISKACSILNTIDSKYTTLVMQLIVSITIITTLTHFLTSALTSFGMSDNDCIDNRTMVIVWR